VGTLRAFRILGVLASVFLIVAGVSWAIPNLGFFGVIWTGFMVVVVVSNVRWLLTRR
jgi:hypothetical protein